MNDNEKKALSSMFRSPADPAEKEKWLKGWTETIFKVYFEVISKASSAMPKINFDSLSNEAEIAKAELQDLIVFKDQPPILNMKLKVAVVPGENKAIQIDGRNNLVISSKRIERMNPELKKKLEGEEISIYDFMLLINAWIS